jgi:hypothetical protein
MNSGDFKGLKEYALRHLQSVAGINLQPLLGSREATEEFLDSTDQKSRMAALFLMTYYWEPTEKFKRICEEMVRNESDEALRRRAIGCLGACFAETGCRRIQRLLARTVSNDSESYHIRLGSYTSLIMVNGLYPMPQGEALANLRIPEDLDWAFIRSILDNKKEKGSWEE